VCSKGALPKATVLPVVREYCRTTARHLRRNLRRDIRYRIRAKIRHHRKEGRAHDDNRDQLAEMPSIEAITHSTIMLSACESGKRLEKLDGPAAALGR
jgi:hypothetical protein